MTARIMPSACSVVFWPAVSPTPASHLSMLQNVTSRSVQCVHFKHMIINWGIIGQSLKIQEPRLDSLSPCQGGGLYWSLERFRTHVGRLFPSGHVQIWSVRDIQGCLHECSWRGALEQIQARHLAGRFCFCGGVRGHRPLPARDDQSQDSDERYWYIPHRLRGSHLGNEQDQG